MHPLAKKTTVQTMFYSTQTKFVSYSEIGSNGVPKDALAMMIFTRDHVEHCDFEEFVNAMNIDQMPPHILRKSMGRFLFSIDGYGQDKRDLVTIPEVRNFYRALHRAWPHWFFFAFDDRSNISPLVLSCLDSTSMVSLGAAHGKVRFTYDPRECRTFIINALLQMNALWLKAGMPEQALKSRWREILGHFGFEWPTDL